MDIFDYYFDPFKSTDYLSQPNHIIDFDDYIYTNEQVNQQTEESAQEMGFCLPEFQLQPPVVQRKPETQVSKLVPAETMKDQEFETETAHNSEESEPHSSFQKSDKAAQSRLHNCPKHLIKVLAMVLGLNQTNWRKNIQALFEKEEDSSTLKAVVQLVGLIQLSYKAKIKSTSKQLLKIIFEEGVEKSKKYDLLKNPLIVSVFSSNSYESVCRGKYLLRQLALHRLSCNKVSCIDSSRIVRKDVNQMYISAFIEELRSGSIKERISKADKLRILEACKP